MPAQKSSTPTVLIRTLGCKVNRYDSERLAADFVRYGFQACLDRRDLERSPELIVVNTCSVTRESDKKSRQLIRRFIRDYPESRLVVTGCGAELDVEQFRQISGVTSICSIRAQGELASQIATQWGLERQEDVDNGELIVPHPTPLPEGEGTSDAGCRVFAESLSLGKEKTVAPGCHPQLRLGVDPKRTRVFVKIQEGCDLFCTYCSIPYSRGEPRSRPVQEIIEEIKHLVDRGFREVVLCGTRLGWYGRDLGTRLSSLLGEIAQISGLVRLRLSSLEPEDFDTEIIEAVASLAILCPHFHLPLQSGSDAILEKMGREYRRTEYFQRIDRAYEQIPDLCISTDIMVGFPGETEEDFAESLSAVERCGFSKVHSFPFSSRDRTPASTMPRQVPPPVRRERRQILDRLALREAEKTRSKFIGRRLPVLTETIEDGHAVGLTPNYLRVRWPATEGDQPNALREVLIEDVSGLSLSGRAE